MFKFKVFCADCMRGYEQGGPKPVCCGWCGSDFIAVKELTSEDLCGTVVEDMEEESMPEPFYRDAATATGMYD